MKLASETTNDTEATSGGLWAWWICALLFLATMINYLDRQSLNVISARIMKEFELTNEQYGWIELCFGLAFATGMVVLGALADRFSVRWFYPVVLACWSLMGFLTGMMHSYAGLLFCRTLLGFFEGGNWPCGITVIQRVLPPSQRSLGNGLLQGGGAIGAMLTPVIMYLCLTKDVGSWRPVFQVIGAIGAVWIVLWLLAMRGRSFLPSSQLQEPRGATVTSADGDPESFWAVIFSRQFFVVLVVALCCNTTWHMVRVWMPLFLQKGRGFSEDSMFAVNTAYFIAADVGCWLAGGVTNWLAGNGHALFRARRVVYFVCCLTTATSVLAITGSNTTVVAILLLVGAGSLGMFPAYFSLSQSLSKRHQGKTIGVLSAAAWLNISILHPLFGKWVDRTNSYEWGIAAIGLLPMISGIVLWTMWTATDDPLDAVAKDSHHG